jgi:hypothetical protein
MKPARMLPGSKVRPGDRITARELVGYTIEEAHPYGSGLLLVLCHHERPDLQATVYRDPEGNGPGALHIFDGNGDFRGIL